jgi:hypothetical protein
MPSPVPAAGTGGRSRGPLALAALAAAVLVGYGLVSRLGPALADEYVYLAGARHFASTGSLDARFYDARAILVRGHPHQDVHPPGYVILLGGLTALLRGGYRTAVGLNVAAFLAGALLVGRLGRDLGFGSRAAGLAAALYLVLPAFLPFVFWAMPEVLLGTLFLAALVVAVRWGDRGWAAVAAGLALGAGILVRETVVFGAAAVVAALRDGRRRIAFLATVVLVVACVHVPLSRNRAPGGVNFWSAPADPQRPGGFGAWHAAREGRVLAALGGLWRRVASNVSGSSAPGATEVGILALFVALPFATLARRRSSPPLAGRVASALVGGWAALAVTILLLFVVGRWSGFRYLMFLMPAFLPWVAGADDGPRSIGRWALPAAIVLACLALQASILGIHNTYKESRQRRQEGLSAYVERYLGSRPLVRVALANGWRYGLERYPTEVISSLPTNRRDLRALEDALWFDYLVVPADAALRPPPDGPVRYFLVNTDDPEPPLRIYRRLR